MTENRLRGGAPLPHLFGDILTNQCHAYRYVEGPGNTDAVVMQLADALSVNTCLTSLVLNGTFTAIGLDRVITALINHPTLRILDVSRTKFDPDMCQLLSKLIVDNHRIRSVVIRSAGLDDQMGIMLVNAAARSQSLQALDLRYNQISPSGLKQIQMIKMRPVPLPIEFLLGITNKFGADSPIQLLSPDIFQVIKTQACGPGCFIIRHNQYEQELSYTVQVERI
jgi:hypothetical protein